MGWNPFKKPPKMPSIPKIPMPPIPDPAQIARDAAKAAEDAANAAAKEAAKQAKAAEKAANDAAKAAEKAAKDAQKAAVKAANDLAKNTQKAVENTTAIVAKNAESYAYAGFDIASDAWQEGSAQTIAWSEQGVEFVKEAAEDAAQWADANMCYIGLNMALTSGCVAYFTPKPAPGDPGTVTSGAISATYLGWLATQGANTAMAMTIGKLITDGMFLIPGVQGSVPKKTMQNVITNAIGTCNPAMLTVSLATPAGVGIFIGSVISPIVAQLVCENVAPKGFTKAYKDTQK
jgi:hypothetical protein